MYPQIQVSIHNFVIISCEVKSVFCDEALWMDIRFKVEQERTIPLLLHIMIKIETYCISNDPQALAQ